MLMKILIESQLGETVIGGGFDGTLQQSTFAEGLKGMERRERAKSGEACAVFIREDR